jgi:hypothetical protein
MLLHFGLTLPDRGVTGGTLKNGYPHVQALSQDKRQGSSEAVACPHDSGACLPAQGSFGGAACPRGSGSYLLA